MFATLVATSMTPNWAIPTTALPPAQLLKTFPKTGFAPSAELAKKTSRLKSKGVDKLTS